MPSGRQTALYQSTGLSPRLGLPISEAKPEPVASPHQGPLGSGLNGLGLSGLRA